VLAGRRGEPAQHRVWRNRQVEGESGLGELIDENTHARPGVTRAFINDPQRENEQRGQRPSAVECASRLCDA
jgi:hypothetical protein